MKSIDLTQNYNHEVVQTSWKNGQLPLVASVVVGDGTLVIMEETTFVGKNKTTYCVQPLCESTVASFMAFENDFVDVDATTKPLAIDGTDCHVVCGEGSMGSEGFVAVVKGEDLVWALFLNISNPFCEVTMGEGQTLIATSNNEVPWEIPLEKPWEAKALSA